MKQREFAKPQALIYRPGFGPLDAMEDIEIYVQCFELILGSLDDRLSKLNIALANLDLTDVSFTAHQLKGGFLLAGSHSLAEICEELISAANRQEVRFASALAARLFASRIAFVTELSALILELKDLKKVGTTPS